MRLLVSMGLKAEGRVEAPLSPVLLELDAETGAVLRRLVWETPPGEGPGPAAHQEFTSGCLLDERTLIQPTHTEVLWIDLRTFRVVHRVGSPWFHALHSAALDGRGGLLLTSASLGAVLQVDAYGRVTGRTLDGEVLPEEAPRDHRLLGHDALKPHRWHPNCAERGPEGQEVHVTCFARSATRRLDDGAETDLGGIPHDGRPRGDRVWFTRIDGQVLWTDPGRRQVLGCFDLAGTSARRLGWCRGIEVAGDRLFVGFTQLRSTQHREVLRWLLQGERGRKEPTRVLVLDPRDGQLRQTFPVGNEAGGTLYGLNVWD